MRNTLYAGLAWLLLGGAALAQAQLGAGQVMGNSTASTRPARAEAMTSILDRAFGTTNGGFIQRGASLWAIQTALGVANGGTGGTTQATARTGLGLGTMATQNSSAVAITGGTITGLGTPSAGSDAANKSYVDGLAGSGLTILPISNYATTAVLPNSPTYSNGASGVGATLTAGANSTLTVDGVVVPLNAVVLVNNQASQLQNGIYTLTTVGSGAAAWVLTRATYFDQAAEMLKGSYTAISAGATQAGTSWVLSATTTTVGTTAVSFNQFATAAVTSIAGNSGAWVLGSGISNSGNTLTNAGVLSIAGNTGVFTLGAGLSNSGNSLINTGVIGSGAPAVGDLAAFTNTTASGAAGTGYTAQQVPGLIPSTSAVTISNASPGIVSWTSHGLLAGATVYFCTTGALPTGLTACVPAPHSPSVLSPNVYYSNPTLFYVCSGSTLQPNSFAVATSLANARAGTCVNTSSAGSGTHTAFANAMACGGCVGELIWKFVDITDGVNLVSTGTPIKWNEIVVPSGIWRVGGNLGVYGANVGSTVITDWHGTVGYGVGSTQTAPYGGIQAARLQTDFSNGIIMPFTEQRFALTGGQTIQSYASAGYTSGPVTMYGWLFAERVK